jgi:hypothetical protein
LEDQQASELKWLDTATQLLDNRFRIPGTEIRFGFDSLIGLIPGIGDIATLSISGILVTVMARKGASGMVLVKMIWNIIIDSVIGAVPILGDIFDFAFRSNRRNLELLKEHYKEGDHQGSAWPVVIVILFVILGVVIGTTYLIWQVLSWSYGLITA